jgi:hypothetical protein
LFGRVHRLCSWCFHTLQYAYGLWFFLALPGFSPLRVALPQYQLMDNFDSYYSLLSHLVQC